MMKKLMISDQKHQEIYVPKRITVIPGKSMQRRMFLASVGAIAAAFAAPRWVKAMAEPTGPSEHSQDSGRDAFFLLPLTKITIGGEFHRRVFDLIENNLLKLDIEKVYLDPFLSRQFPPDQWVFMGTGVLLRSAANFELFSGDSRISDKRKLITQKLISAQDESGYIGVRLLGATWKNNYEPEDAADIMQGFSAVHRHFGNAAALGAAEKLARAMMTAYPLGTEIRHEAIDLPEGFDDLYELTHDESYVDYYAYIPYESAAKSFGFIAGYEFPEDQIGRTQVHCYANFERSRGQLLLYRRRPDPQLLESSQQIIDFLCKRNGMYIIGSTGNNEQWRPPKNGSPETCATAYLLLLLHEMIRISGDLEYGDLMERTIYNALFAAPTGDSSKIRYHNPMEGVRAFEAPWKCCENNYRRVLSELPQMIYYASSGNIAINLFTGSQAEFSHIEPAGLIRMRQETAYPTGERILIYIDPQYEAEFSLTVRIPRWCNSARLKVNGQSMAIVPNDRKCIIHRRWTAGDKVEIELPMSIRIIKAPETVMGYTPDGIRAALPDPYAGRIAVLRGPQVFCLNHDLNARRNGNTVFEDDKVVIDPETLRGPMPDNTARPDGVHLSVKGWSSSGKISGKHDLDLLLTEYPDEGGTITYLYCSDIALSVPDEFTRFGEK